MLRFPNLSATGENRFAAERFHAKTQEEKYMAYLKGIFKKALHILLFFTIASYAQQLPRNPVQNYLEDGSECAGIKGTSVLGDKPFELLTPWNAKDFETKLVSVEGQPFKEAMQITVNKQPNAVWEMQVRGNPKVPVNKGDKLLVTLYMRGLSAETEFAETSTVILWQLNRPPRSVAFSFRPRAIAGKGWKKFQKVFVSEASLDAKGSIVSLQFGFIPQSFEIGGLSIYKYGPEIDTAALPQIKEELYEGHQADAPWRKAADERIDKFRKVDLELKVTDPYGKPFPDVKVHVKMTRHHFLWETTLYHWFFSGDFMKDEKSRRYTEEAVRLFNFAVSENGFKWEAWEDEKGRSANDNLVKWAQDHEMPLRGHTVVWPSFKHSPKRLEKLKGDPDALRAEINRHIDEIITREKGKLLEWDVLNEPTVNVDFMRILGDDEPAKWFSRVHGIDPDARLFLNENSILAGTKLKSMEDWLDRLVKDGAPIGGIGIQGHLSVGTAAPESIMETLNRLSRYKIPIAITELDVISDDPALQAMYLRDVLTVFFSHPSVESVNFWGFWDGRHWKNNTPFFDKNWNPKPGLEVYKKLVFGDWWTDQTVKTDKEGGIKTRVFKGDYEISVEIGGKIKTMLVIVNDHKKLAIHP